MAPIVRFAFFLLRGEGNGHVQSLVLGGAMLVLGAVAVMLGILADLIAGNRKLLEATLEHVRRIENQMALGPQANESPPQDAAARTSQYDRSQRRKT